MSIAHQEKNNKSVNAGTPFFLRVLREEWRFASVIFFAGLTILVGVLTLFISLNPTQTVASLPFRLEFEGASSDLYPNKNKFTPYDILSMPVLWDVYVENDLSGKIPFDRFIQMISVHKDNQAVRKIELDFKEKLADKRLGLVDRERLEKEFVEMTKSLQGAEFQMDFKFPNGIFVLKRDQVEKILSSVLYNWSIYADTKQGIFRQPISLNLSDLEALATPDANAPIVSYDILMRTASAITKSLNRLNNIPGGSVTRSQSGNMTYLELQDSLDRLISFRLKPYIQELLLIGTSGNDYPYINAYFASQLRQNMQYLDSLQGEVQSYIEAMRLLDPRISGTPEVAKVLPNDQGQMKGPYPDNSTVIPQLNESFLNQVIRLAYRNDDVLFKQRLINTYLDKQNQTVAVQRLIKYYQDIKDSIETAKKGGIKSNQDNLAEFNQRYSEIYKQILDLTHQAMEIYDSISVAKNNISQHMYTITMPVTFQNVGMLSMRNLLFIGALALAFLACATYLICMIRIFRKKFTENETSHPGMPMGS